MTVKHRGWRKWSRSLGGPLKATIVFGKDMVPEIVPSEVWREVGDAYMRGKNHNEINLGSYFIKFKQNSYKLCQ
jgi:hypothetical protein